MTYSANLSFFATKTSDTGAINSGIDGVPIGANTASTGKFTSVTNTGLTSGRVTFAGASGLLSDNANFTFNGTELILGAANPSFQGSSSTGSASLLNNSGGAFVRVYGGSHATRANYTDFINASSTSTFTSAGYLGIGTSSPGSILTVGNGTASEYIDVTFNGGTSSNYGPVLGFQKGGTSFGQIANYGRIQGGTSSDFFITSVGSNAVVFGIGQTEKVRIDTNGRLGIGISSPTSRLTIGTDSFTSAGSNTTGMYTGVNGLIVLSDGLFIATRAGVDRVVVDTSGNVGIGNTPSGKLDITSGDGSTNANGVFVRGSTGVFAVYPHYDATLGSLINSFNSAISAYKPMTFQATNFAFNPNGTERMSLSSGGQLTVTTSGVNGTVKITSSDGAGGYGANMALNNTGTGGRQYWISSTSNGDGEVGGGKMKFYDSTANATRMLIDADGDVGIGTTNPISKLHISGSNTYAGGGLLLGSASAVSGYIWTTDHLYIKPNNSGGTTSGAVYIQNISEVNRFAFDTSTIRLGVGVTSPSSALDISGVGDGLSRWQMRVAQSYTLQIHTNITDTAYADAWHDAGLYKWQVSGAEKMRLDSSGNLGIGTSIPGTYGKVAISVTGTATPTTQANVGPASINLFNGGGGGTTNSTMGIFGWHAGEPGLGSGIGFSRDSSGDWAASIRFYTHPVETSNIGVITERMRIDGNGNISVGGFAPNAWQTGGYRFMQFLDATGLYVGGSSYGSQIGVNSYINSNSQWIYGGSDYRPARYEQFNGYHAWYKAGLGSAGTVISWTQAMTLTNENKLLVGQTSTSNGTGITLQPNLATAAVGHSGSFATVWNIPAGTVGIFAVNMGGGGQYGGARLFFVCYGAAGVGYNNAYVEVIGGPGGDQSGYSWSYNIASNGQFQMRNDVNAVAFTPTICMISLGG
jgi:hypothetical protein